MSILLKLKNHDKEILNGLKGDDQQSLFDSLEQSQGDTSNKTLLMGFDEVGRGCLAGPVCTAAYASFAGNLGDDFFEFSDEGKLEYIQHLNDSKKVPHTKRKFLTDTLKDYKQGFWSVDFQSAETIDKIGIVSSIWKSMTNNLLSILDKLYATSKPDGQNYPQRLILLVDGPKTIKDLELSYEKWYLGLLANSFEQTNKNSKGGLQNLRSRCSVQFESSKFSSNFTLSHGEYKTVLDQIAIKKGDSQSALIAAASNIAKHERDEYMQKQAKAKKYSMYHWDTNVGYGTAKHRDAINKHGVSKLHRKSFLEKILEE